MYSPYGIPGFPKDFQPQCFVYVTFVVEANINSTAELVLLLGNTLAMGNGMPADAPQLWPFETNQFNLTVQLPANSEVSYRYVRYEYSVDGAYTYEAENRTLQTGGCSSPAEPSVVHDQLSAGRPASRARKLLQRHLPAMRAHDTRPLQARQMPLADTPGSMLGLPGRELIDPAYNISSHQGDGELSAQTIPTNLYHENGLTEYDTHNLYGTMISTASPWAMINRRPGLRPLT